MTGGAGVTYVYSYIPDGDAAAVLLVFPCHHHPVRGVAVHTVLHHRVQLLATIEHDVIYRYR